MFLKDVYRFNICIISNKEKWSIREKYSKTKKEFFSKEFFWEFQIIWGTFIYYMKNFSMLKYFIDCSMSCKKEQIHINKKAKELYIPIDYHPKNYNYKHYFMLDNSAAKCYSIMLMFLQKNQDFFCHHKDMSQIIKCILSSMTLFLIYVWFKCNNS